MDDARIGPSLSPLKIPIGLLDNAFIQAIGHPNGAEHGGLSIVGGQLHYYVIPIEARDVKWRREWVDDMVIECYYPSMRQRAYDNRTTGGMNMNDELLTLKECELLTKRKVATWRHDVFLGTIPYVKLGSSIRIKKSVLLDLIAAGSHEPKPREA